MFPTTGKWKLGISSYDNFLVHKEARFNTIEFYSCILFTWRLLGEVPKNIYSIKFEFSGG